MSDRDHRRFADALHPTRTESGEIGHVHAREDQTPVEVLKEIRDKIDAAAIVAEVDRDMPEHFARIDAVARRAEAKAALALARWKWPMRIASGLAAFSLAAVTWVLAETRSAGYEARVNEERERDVEQLKVEVRSIRETLIRFGERLNAWRPVDSLPVVGPHNKDE